MPGPRSDPPKQRRTILASGMSEGYSEGHYVLGIAGLALLRAGAEHRGVDVDRSVSDILETAARLDEASYSEQRQLPEHPVNTGYERWAEGYDDPGNDTIALEEPVVRALLDDLPPGPVLDAACGTGRHAAYLAAAGREVIGVDASEAMLARARVKLPRAELRTGELEALPLEDAAVAGVVCALALSHLPQLAPAVSELARVLRPGGRVVISVPHPLAVGVLGWRAVFKDEAGERAMIREYPHLHSDYMAAFARAGLIARRLIEPRLTPQQARARSKAGRDDTFERALAGAPALMVWEAERSSAPPG